MIFNAGKRYKWGEYGIALMVSLGILVYKLAEHSSPGAHAQRRIAKLSLHEQPNEAMEQKSKLMHSLSVMFFPFFLYIYISE